MLTGLVALLAGLSLGPATPSTGVELEWAAPAGCPDQASIRTAVEELLRAPRDGDGEIAGVHVRARIESRPHGEWRLELRTRTGSGTTRRTLTASSCAVLADYTALVTAIAVDPTLVLERVVADEDEQPSLQVPAVVQADRLGAALVDESERERDRADAAPATRELELRRDDLVEIDDPQPRRKVRFAMRATGGGDFGALPGFAGGLDLTGSVLGRRWRAEIGIGYFFPRVGSAEVDPDVGGRISLLLGAARGCGVPGVRRVEFPLCGGLEAGVMRGEGIGDDIVDPTTTSEPWLAATAGPGLAWVPRRYLAVGLQVVAVIPILRPAFEVGGESVHRAGPVGIRALAGLEARFP